MTERTEIALVIGEAFRLKLVRLAPGRTDVVLELGAKIQGRIGMADVLERAARLDPEGADAAQRTIQELRQKVGDLESKVYDQKADKLMLDAFREEIAQLKATAPAPVASAAPVAAFQLAARFEALLSGVRAHLGKCERCKGTGEVREIGFDPHDGDDFPCAKCVLLRQLVKVVEAP